MTNKLHQIQRTSRSSLILIILTISILTGTVGLLLVTPVQQAPSKILLPPESQSSETTFQAADLPSTYPAYTGSGSPRTAVEKLQQTQGKGGDATNGLDIPFDLPGTGYWTGTRLDLTVTDIFEKKDWITNGDFSQEFWVPTPPWNVNDDSGGYTGPPITIDRDTDYVVDVGTHGDAASFTFEAQSSAHANPPQYTSGDADNEGDVGAPTGPTFEWSASTNMGGGTANSVTNDRRTGYPWGAGDSGGTGNRNGAWRFYISDSEAASSDSYTVTFTSRYTFDFPTALPVSSASFKFSYRYYSFDFDQGPLWDGHYDSDRDRFVFSYNVYTQTGNLGWQTEEDWQAVGGSDPGDPGWIEIAPVDLRAAGLFGDQIGGSFYVEFRLVVYMDVDDARSYTSYDCNHDAWCNYETCWHWTDENNEDSDYLYFFIDGLELTAMVPTIYDGNVDPDIEQTITFNNRNATAWTNLALDYFIPSTFLPGSGADGNVYLDVVITGTSTSTHRFSIRDSPRIIDDDQWHTLVLQWGAPDYIGNDIGSDPGPPTITIEISIVFTVAGWYAQGITQSLWIDNVELYIENYAPADVAQLVCKDEEHSNNTISWDYITEHTCGFSFDSTWQTVTDSSTFWLDSTSDATIQLTNVVATFYANDKYHTLTPTFSVPTEPDGLSDTVTWTITHDVVAIANQWEYTLDIPYIPDWSASDWNVVSVEDSIGQPVTYSEPAWSGMKNISIYADDEDNTGIWTITCTSLNKVTDFDVQDQTGSTSYDYYVGGASASRINFSTAADSGGAGSLIWVNYTDHQGIPVSGSYPDETILPNSVNPMPLWNIPNDAVPNDHYVTMVKWIDQDSWFDEVGFAARYVRVKRNVSVSAVTFLQENTLSSSNIVVAGEKLTISVNVTDALVNPSLVLDTCELIIDYPDILDRFNMLQETLTLTKSGNVYSYTLETDGVGGDPWLLNSAWMGGVGNRTFTISLLGNSTYLNGVWQNYIITGWFIIMVDTAYDLPTISETMEQGLTFILAVELEDWTDGHADAITRITDSDLINNRTFGSPITDLTGDGYADTWNGSVFMRWNIIPDNLTDWCGGDLGQMNDANHKWNGTLELKDGFANRYEAIIKIPFDATPTSTMPGVFYNINVTTTMLDNSWGWKFEPQYMTIAQDNGPDMFDTWDDHRRCFLLDVILATGFETTLGLDPSSTPGSPLEYYWDDQSGELTRLYTQFYNTTDNMGFNSSFISSVDNLYVESWVTNPKVPESFGNSSTRLQWSLVSTGTLLPNGSADPRAENSIDPTTWGWFYADYNWTLVNLGLGTFIGGLLPTTFEIYLFARIENLTGKWRSSSEVHYIKINPNPVNLTISLRYPSNSTNPTFLDENYYTTLNMSMTDTLYWGDLLNFTLDATGILEGAPEAGVSLQYILEKSGIGLVKEGWINATGILGRYSAVLNTSDPANGIEWGDFWVTFRGIKENRSIISFPHPLTLTKRETRMMPERIAGVFVADAIYDYGKIDDIMEIDLSKPYIPMTSQFRTIANHTIHINVSLFDNTPRFGGPINEVSIRWELRQAGIPQLSGWVNTSIGGIFSITIDLSSITIIGPGDLDKPYELWLKPYKDNYENELQQYPGSYWSVDIIIGFRPIVLIPIVPRSMTYSQSNWINHPIQFVAMDPISGENISGCTINWRIENTEYEGVYMDEYEPGHYQVIFDTWPSLFSWISQGTYPLSAEIVNTPNWYYATAGPPHNWQVSELQGNDRVFLHVESEGFLGPLSTYFYIILGAIGAVVLAYTSYKSYKFLTTPYVIRKIEESIDKISKDKKIAAGVMKSRDHLIFLEATDLLQIVGIVLKPPPLKKLPPPIAKVAPKVAPEVVEKIPEVPMDIISAELDKVGVRPEEKPILLQQIKELGPVDRQEFVESLIGEERFKELTEELEAKEASKPNGK